MMSKEHILTEGNNLPKNLNLTLLLAFGGFTTIIFQSGFMQVAEHFYFRNAFTFVTLAFVVYQVININKDFVNDDCYRSKFTCLLFSLTLMFLPSLHLIWTGQLDPHSAFFQIPIDQSITLIPMTNFLPWIFLFFLCVPERMYRRPAYLI